MNLFGRKALFKLSNEAEYNLNNLAGKTKRQPSATECYNTDQAGRQTSTRSKAETSGIFLNG